MVLEKTIEKLDKLIASQEQTTAPQEKKKAEPKKKPQQQQPVKKKAAAEGSPYAFDIRVGKILTVEKHPVCYNCLDLTHCL
jgi:tRNA-binding EMAP/Myf-like protein